ncbi:uncharacterized protein VTP21DRAFT_11624 [Calcarisporiella thermophila]|uniref:uncharacterized protein n=1 Tax=Calcarisporiella thermophila TaxID=911321 RepID=UPI0037436EDA
MIKHAESIPDGETCEALSNMAKDAGVYLIGGTIAERAANGKLYNTCVVFGPDGSLLSKHRKMHLSDQDIISEEAMEADVFSPGNSIPLLETAFGKIGIGIRDDLNVPEIAMVAARQGCIAMIYPAAFHSNIQHWELLQRARAIDNQIYIATCLPALNYSSTASKQRISFGRSTVVAPNGEILSTTRHEETIVYATIDSAFVKEVREGTAIRTQRRFDVYLDVAGK